MSNARIYRILRHFLVFLSCFVFAYTSGSFIFIQRDSAAESSNISVGVQLNPVIAMSITPSSLLISLKPTPIGVETSDTIEVRVDTNNLVGYKLDISAATSDTNLIHTNNISSIPSTDNLFSAPGALQQNTWGYNTTYSAQDYIRIPNKTTPDTIASTTAPASNDITLVTVGINADTSIPSGTYINTLEFSAVTNPIPTPQITNISPSVVEANETIIINGVNFYGETASSQVLSVKIGTTDCLSFSVISDSEISCIVPDIAGGTHPVIVNTPMGASDSEKTIDISVIATEVWVKAASDLPEAIASIMGPSKNNFIVEVDDNMIPVVNKDTKARHPNNWCNYDSKQWCNAVTVKPTTLDQYKNSPKGTEIIEADILAYWVYIPRYAYEVQRLSPWHKPIANQSPFDIRFETAATPKKTPYSGTYGMSDVPASPDLGSCTSPPSIVVSAESTAGVDYRTDCTGGASGLSREYPVAEPYDRSTWSTHPAFTIDMDSDGTIEPSDGEELNGFWVGKYENGMDTFCTNSATQAHICGNTLIMDGGKNTIGSVASPLGGTEGQEIYIKAAKAPQTLKYAGAKYSQILNFGTNPLGLLGGTSAVAKNEGYNTMNLAHDSQTVQINNRQWGAIAYLSTSIHGIGDEPCTNSDCTSNQKKVRNNAYWNDDMAINTTDITSTPQSPSTIIRLQTGCGPVNVLHDYYGAECNPYHSLMGQLASTTGNIYGVYDMAGGEGPFCG